MLIPQYDWDREAKKVSVQGSCLGTDSRQRDNSKGSQRIYLAEL